GEYPYRIELFDTEIDSIRTFDLGTQRSHEPLHDVTIYQFAQISRDENQFIKARGRISRAYNRHIKQNPELAESLSHRRDQLIEYTESMINLQYMEKFLYYFYDELDYLWDYMEDFQLMIDNPSRCIEVMETLDKERQYEIEEMIQRGRCIDEDFRALTTSKDYFELYKLDEGKNRDTFIFTPFVMTIKGPHGASDSPKLKDLVQIENRQIHQYGGHLDVLKADLEGYIARGFEIKLVCSNEERKQNLLDFVQREGFNSRILPGRHKAGQIEVVSGTLTAGMEFTDRKECYIWEGDIFGESRRGSKSRRRAAANLKSGKSKRINSFADLDKGDYVVHEAHGIGRFTGVEQLNVQGLNRDFLRVEYAGTDMLYIPVDQLDQLQKYIGGDGITPKINKLSSNEWKSTKAKAVAAVSDMAEELLRVANTRRNTPGHAFSEDTKWQRDFENSFPYTETEDQLTCIEEIKHDMQNPYPMDRLLCGDVGFGKTEVAARALFKCVIEGKQAAVLVPTTLLANQHYYTLKS
ncbi:MAG: CarD family transcriptional regulator, partial [Bacillota bacterium]|nr:CarD family transcriptional regulator [Bacillota bacterium]